MAPEVNIALLGFAGYSGAGKTTLLKKIIHSLTDSGYRIALVKHAHHDFDLDKPGKDSYELRKAGASQILVASAKREALIIEKEADNPDRKDPDLFNLLKRLDTDKLDLVLVEGFKNESFDKIEVHRHANNKPLLYVEDPSIIAIATDLNIDDISIPLFNLNSIPTIINFIKTRYLCP